MLGCFSASSARLEAEELSHWSNRFGSLGGVSAFCDPAALPPHQEEVGCETAFGEGEQCALIAFGAALSPPSARSKQAETERMVKVEKEAKRVLRKGVPDDWKAFAWYHASGAAAFAREVGSGEEALKTWYNGCLTNTFGENRVPNSFAVGASGRAPMFNQGIIGNESGTKEESRLLEKSWPNLMAPLSESGLNAAKRILWVLNWLWQGQADFCPWVPALVVAFLLFSEEHDVCAAIHCMLARISRTPLGHIRQGGPPLARAFLFYDRSGINRAVRQFLLIGQRSGSAPSKAISSLSRFGVDVNGFVAGNLQDCLAAMLPLRAFLRLATTILCDGWKAPARWLLQLLGRAAPTLAKCTTAEALTHQLSLELLAAPTAAGGAELDAFVVDAFRPPLSSRKHPFGAKGADACLTSFLEEAPAHHLTWPRSGAPGNSPGLVDEAALVTLWSGPLPLLTRQRRPQLIFSCARDGYNLHTLLRRCEEISESGKDVPMIFLVGTDACGVVGGYSPVLWRGTGGGWIKRTQRFEEAFVFALPRVRGRSVSCDMDKSSPTRTVVPMVAYHWTGANEFLFCLSDDGLLFGGDSPALSIDKDLLHGSTSKSATFGSPPLQVPDLASQSLGTLSVGMGPGAATISMGLRGTAAEAAPEAAVAPMPLVQTTIDFKVEAIEVIGLVEEDTA